MFACSMGLRISALTAGAWGACCGWGEGCEGCGCGMVGTGWGATGTCWGGAWGIGVGKIFSISLGVSIFGLPDDHLLVVEEGAGMVLKERSGWAGEGEAFSAGAGVATVAGLPKIERLARYLHSISTR